MLKYALFCLVLLSSPLAASEPPAYAKASKLAKQKHVSTLVVDDKRLTSYQWKLTEAIGAHGPRLDALVANPSLPLSVRFQEKARLSLAGGCNQQSGSYQLQSGNLVVSALATTEMACENAALMGQDQAIATLLSRPVQINLEAGPVSYLVLDTASGDALRFEGIKVPFGQ